MKNKITTVHVLVGSVILLGITGLVIYLMQNKNKPQSVPVPTNTGTVNVTVPRADPPKVVLSSLGRGQLIYRSTLYNENFTPFGEYQVGALVGNIIGTYGDWYIVDYYGAGKKYVYKSNVQVL